MGQLVLFTTYIARVNVKITPKFCEFLGFIALYWY